MELGASKQERHRQEDEFFQGYNITLRQKVTGLIPDEVIGFFN
jgi:hypothetical protein